MEITTGRLISKQVIFDIIKPIPKKYLKVKNIIVSVVPDKKVKKEHYRWGGLTAQVDPDKKEIKLYMYAIGEKINDRFRNNNNNWYHTAIKELADNIYWGIATLNVKKELKKKVLLVQLLTKRLETTGQKAGVFDKIPKPSRIKFLKIWRDNHFDLNLRFLRSGEVFRTSWLPYIDHLRKVRLGLRYKYNFPQLLGEFSKDLGKLIQVRLAVDKLYDGFHLNPTSKDEVIWNDTKRLYQRNLKIFKEKVIKILKPKYYVSKRGYKYAYFTDKHLIKLKKELKWTPKIEVKY